MDRFNIEVIDKEPKGTDGYLYYEGKITVGDYTEELFLAFDMWTLHDYWHQWKAGIERLKTHDSSCLVTDITFVEVVGLPRIELWSLYKVGETVFMQSRYFGGESVEKAVTAKASDYECGRFFCFERRNYL